MMSDMDEDEDVFIGQNPEGGIDRFRVSRYHSNTYGWEPLLILIAGRHETEWILDVDQAEGLGRELLEVVAEVRSLAEEAREWTRRHDNAWAEEIRKLEEDGFTIQRGIHGWWSPLLGNLPTGERYVFRWTQRVCYVVVTLADDTWQEFDREMEPMGDDPVELPRQAARLLREMVKDRSTSQS